MILPGNPRQKVMVPCSLENLDVLGGVRFLVGQDGTVFPVGRRSRQRILSPAVCGLSIACRLSFVFSIPDSKPLEGRDLADVFRPVSQVQCLLASCSAQTKSHLAMGLGPQK